jgi:hypothetical protein
MSSKKLRPAVYEVDTNAEVSFYIPATAPEILGKNQRRRSMFRLERLAL